MAYNRYFGNTGRVVRMSEPKKTPPDTKNDPPAGFGLSPPVKKPANPFAGLPGGIGGLFSKFSFNSLEMEDILILLILYLLYRESGDKEWLIILGVMLFM